MRLCEICNIDITAKQANAKTCSQRCNMALWRRNNPEKSKENSKRNEAKRKGINRYDSDYRKSWYEKKKADPEWKSKVRQQEKDRYYKVKRFLNDYKKNLGCADCGYNNPIALDFDHITGNKIINVCNTSSIEYALSEIKKCEVVCANCHRIRTYNRMKTNPKNYRKKPIVIQAYEITQELLDNVEENPIGAVHFYSDHVEVETLEGRMRGELGGFVVKGIEGEEYVCKRSIFFETYEPADSTPTPNLGLDIPEVGIDPAVEGKDRTIISEIRMVECSEFTNPYKDLEKEKEPDFSCEDDQITPI